MLRAAEDASDQDPVGSEYIHVGKVVVLQSELPLLSDRSSGTLGFAELRR